MSEQLSAFGVIGLAVMGQNLARNVASRGYRTSVYNRTTDKMTDLIAEYGSDTLVGQESLESFVQSLEQPRKIMIMVKAGKPVDSVIADLLPLLGEGDIIIDGGNSLYTDTIRREKELTEKGLYFFGCGVSGGEEGALEGPSLMPGGSDKVWEWLKPILESIAAEDFSGGKCVTHIGENGAGHYVKMVHNGIEYAIMQMIAESYQLLEQGFGLEPPEIANVFDQFNKGRLSSYLFEIAVPILKKRDDLEEGFLIDKILDQAGQKGTGRWTAIESFQRGTEVSTIAQAVNARVSSSEKEKRTQYAERYDQLRSEMTKTSSASAEAFVLDLEKALYVAILVAYEQGFDLLSKTAKEQDWDLDFSEISRIWQGGCIIRADILKVLQEAFGSSKDSRPSLLMIDSVVGEVSGGWGSLKEVMKIGIDSSVPMYCFGAALTSLESLTSSRTSANMLQGLRDYFGAHTYKRIDREGVFHSDWES